MTHMLKRLTIIALLSVILSSCRVNNGDIGDYFGSWLLYDMKIDGETPSDFDGEQTFWEFQNNIVQISRVMFMYERDSRVGTWKETGEELLFDFAHHDDNHQAGTSKYRAPEWIGMVSDEIMHLTFDNRSSDRMTLSWHSPDGQLYTYSLRKIW